MTTFLVIVLVVLMALVVISLVRGIIAFLQSTPVFDAASWPTLPPGIEKLVLELTPLKLEEQSEVWSALRATQHPSVFYRAKLLVLHDAKSTTAEQVTLPVVVKVAQSPEPARA